MRKTLGEIETLRSERSLLQSQSLSVDLQLLQPTETTAGDFKGFSRRLDDLFAFEGEGNFYAQFSGEMIVAGAGEGKWILGGPHDVLERRRGRGNGKQSLDGVRDGCPIDAVMLLSSYLRVCQDPRSHELRQVSAG